MALKASMLSLVGAAMLATALPVAAHHSIAAEFDTSKQITFTGTVKVVEWTNPHTYTQVEVKNPDGTSTVYRVEGGPPNALFRQGWRKDSLKAGETVTVSGLRAKNANSMNVGQATITTSDGRTMFGQTNASNR
jgi:DNA/RNA endonuclease YhcR with UshA esterase domain